MPNLRALICSIAIALAAMPAAWAASKCAIAIAAEWPVKLEQGHIVVEGAINGQKVGVMLDTGASTLILRSSAERLDLVRRDARGSRAFGIGGETRVETTNVDEFKLGAITLRNWRSMVAGERSLGKSTDVILGEDFLEQLDVEFDLAHDAVRLYEVKDCDGVVLAYWAPAASQVNFDSSYNARRSIAVPVQINGKPLQALLDSGASSSVLDKPAAEQLGLTPASPGVTFGGRSGGLGGKLVDFWIGPLRTFTIGGETISDTTIAFADLFKDATDTPTGSHIVRKVGSPPALLLGADFLRAHRVLISHSQRKIYFTYEGGPVFEPKGPGGPATNAKAAEGESARVAKPEAN
jgi:clan AA aspartic protease (TIGR02281 family)